MKLNYPKILYSRYADDILFSSQNAFKLNVTEIKELISNHLKELSLSLNEKKELYFELKNEGDHFKYLGLNYVLIDNNTRIRIGKKYLKSVAINYVKREKKLLVNEYEIKKNIGQLNYIKDICTNEEKHYFKEVLLPIYKRSIKE